MFILFYLLLKNVVLPDLLGTIYPLAKLALNFFGIYLILIIGIVGLTRGFGSQITTSHRNSSGIISIFLQATIGLGSWILHICENIVRAVYHSLREHHPVAAWIVSILVAIILI